jgi:hypothetical protein
MIKTYLGTPHHTVDSIHHNAWWWTYSEGEGAPPKYFNVVFKYSSVVQVAETADIAKPQLLRDDEAPFPSPIEEPINCRKGPAFVVTHPRNSIS